MLEMWLESARDRLAGNHLPPSLADLQSKPDGSESSFTLILKDVVERSDVYHLSRTYPNNPNSNPKIPKQH